MKEEEMVKIEDERRVKIEDDFEVKKKLKVDDNEAIQRCINEFQRKVKIEDEPVKTEHKDTTDSGDLLQN